MDERELFSGLEDSNGNLIKMSYPKIHEMLRAVIPDGRVADTFFRAYRYASPVDRVSKDGIPTTTYDLVTGLEDGKTRRRIVLRRLSFHGGYTSLDDMQILSKALPLDIKDEYNLKRKFKPGKQRDWRGITLRNHWNHRLPMWGGNPSFDLTKELEELLGWHTVMTMWDHALRYGHGNCELVDDARKRSGIQTYSERMEELKIRKLERADIQKPRRGRPRIIRLDDMIGDGKVNLKF